MRVALVGCGRIARVHRSYLAALPQVELIGCWDQDAGALGAFAREAGIPPFATMSDLLQVGRPNVVHVLTPPRTHAALTLESLDAGVNVLVEKPLAVDTAEAETVLEAARRNQRWVSVDHNRWFDPVVQRAASLLDNGRLGRLVGVDVFQGADVEALPSGGQGHWSQELPGGYLHNLASHPLYLLRRFAGVVRDLHLVTQWNPDGSLEEVRLAARGERALASMTLSLRTQPFMNRLTLFGTEASIEVNLNNMTLVVRQPRELPKVLGKVWPNLSEAAQLLRATWENGFSFLTGRQRYYPGIGVHLRTLYERVAAGMAPPVTAEEGRDVVAWYEEILRQRGGPSPAPSGLGGA